MHWVGSWGHAGRNVGAGAGSSRGDPESVSVCRSQSASGALPSCRSHFYNHPNLDLLPGLASGEGGTDSGAATANEWFDYIKSMKLRTYFNDHPFPGTESSFRSFSCRHNSLSL